MFQKDIERQSIAQTDRKSGQTRVLHYKLFDPTHLFKNFYNNLMNKDTFIYPTVTFQNPSENAGSTTIPGNVIPTIEDSLSTAEFSHLVDLHELD